MMEQDGLRRRVNALYNQVEESRDEEISLRGRSAASAQRMVASTPNPEQEEYYVTRQETCNQRTETKEMLRQFTVTMTGFLQRFVDVGKQPRLHQQVLEQFEGKVEEDPHRFLNIMQHYIDKLDYQSDLDRITVIRAQLKGEARKWAETIKNAPITFQAFRYRFIDEFNSPKRLAEAYHQLYARAQLANETAEEFISHKQALLARLKPNMDIETTIEIIISLLKPALASRVIGARPESIEVLIKTVRRIETEVQKEYQLMDSTRKVNQQTPIIKSPCRWCQQWHMSYNCEQNPYRNISHGQRTNEQYQGNVRRAEAAAPTVAQARANVGAAGRGRREVPITREPTEQRRRDERPITRNITTIAENHRAEENP